MTTHHIETGTGADGTRFARIMRDGPDCGRGLTVRAPSNRTADADGVDMDPRPVPGEEPHTTLDHAAAALDGLLSSDDYIRIDEDDVRNICADVAATLVVMEAVSPATIGGTFGDRLSDLGIPGGAVTGALVAIEGPKDMGLSEASSIVDEVRGNLTDEANIIWGLNLADTGATHVTVLVATPRER